MSINDKVRSLIRHLNTLVEMKSLYEAQIKSLEEAMNKLNEFGPDRKYYVNLLGVLMVETSYEEAKKHLEDQIMLLKSRIARIEKQIEEIRKKITPTLS